MNDETVATLLETGDADSRFKWNVFATPYSIHTIRYNICHQIQHIPSKSIWNINHTMHSAMCSSSICRQLCTQHNTFDTPHADWVVPFRYLSLTRYLHWWCWRWIHLTWDIPRPSQDPPSSAPRNSHFNNSIWGVFVSFKHITHRQFYSTHHTHILYIYFIITTS